MKKLSILALALVLVFSLPVYGQAESVDVNEELKEALPGIWEITAWDLTTGGFINVVEGWFLRYTDDTIWFYMDGELVNEEGYEWINENTQHFWYKEDPTYVGDWAYELQEDGSLIITYDEYGVVYYAEKRPDDTDPLAYVPIDAVAAEGGTIAPEDLVGSWDLNSMTVAGVETPLEDQAFAFTEDSVQYVISGVPINDSSYTFADEYNLTVVSKEDESNVANWNLDLQADGTLVITDTTNGFIYNLSKPAGPIDPEDLVGSWNLISMIIDDVETELEDQTFDFTEDSVQYVVAGVPSNDSTYVFEDEYNITVTSKEDEELTTNWELVLQADGTLIITDTNGVVYKLKQPEEGAIAPEDLIGSWNLNSMTIAGTETALEDQGFDFTEDSVQYVISGVPINDSSYTFADASNLTVVSKDDETNVANWALEIQEDGTLIITDTTNGFLYNCTKLD